MSQRLQLTEEMRQTANVRLDEANLDTDEFEHLLQMPIGQMTPANKFDLVMYASVACDLMTDAIPDGIFGDGAKSIVEYYHIPDFLTSKKSDVDYNLLLIALHPLNPNIVLDGEIGREADIAIGHFMALRHELEND